MIGSYERIDVVLNYDYKTQILGKGKINNNVDIAIVCCENFTQTFQFRIIKGLMEMSPE